MNTTTKAMNVIPEANDVKTGVKNISEITKGLSVALADTYRLVFKTHAYHWNVEGPMFFSIHHLTEEQYQDMFEAADVIAERIRALGQLTPMRLDDIIAASCVKDPTDAPSAQHMVDDLAQDHAAVAKRLHGLIKTADEGNDPVTADLITARSSFHETAAWMLRATAK
ncbi:Dps family protein [Phaeovulum sp.]|uniref:Dps family protein n=1 Tax=Phaeovulum sp. TaxID=2934796 RepID=UPI0039E6DF4B